MKWEQLTADALDAGFPRWAPFGPPVALSGGNLNYVWRVQSVRGPVIAKRSPPFAAAVPSLALSPRRLLLEARALRAFEKPPLLGITEGAVRPPRLLGFCRKAWLLLEEDAGPGPDLSQSLGDPATFRRLGAFIAGLHRESFGSAALRHRFANLDVQRTRLASQYAQVGAFAERAGAQDAAAIDARALALGQRWLEPGRCLVMGDLWPASVLPRQGGLRLIDWEFATFGSPAQDVGHLVAHLLLLGFATGTQRAAADATDAFLAHYRVGLREQFHEVWDEEVHRDAGLHIGCELLARASGPFRATVTLEPDALGALTKVALAALRGVPPSALAPLE